MKKSWPRIVFAIVLAVVSCVSHAVPTTTPLYVDNSVLPGSNNTPSISTDSQKDSLKIELNHTDSVQLTSALEAVPTAITIDVKHHPDEEYDVTGAPLTAGSSHGEKNRPDQQSCATMEFIFVGIIMAGMCAFGLVGNSLTILTFWPNISTNSTSFVLVGLAMYDTAVCITFFFLKCVTSYCKYFNSCRYYFQVPYIFVATYMWPLATALHMAATWTILLVTLQRYVAVCYPHNVNKYASVRIARIQVVSVGILALAWNIPEFVNDYLKVNSSGTGVVRIVLFQRSKLYEYLYEIMFFYLIMYVIPFTSLIFMTVRLLKALKKSRDKRDKMTRMKSDENDLTFTLVMVVIVFMVCQLASPVRRMLSYISSQACGSFLFYWTLITANVIIFNSCCNFLLYCIFSPRFRKALYRQLGVRRHGNEVGTLTDMSLQNKEVIISTSKRLTKQVRVASTRVG